MVLVDPYYGSDGSAELAPALHTLQLEFPSSVLLAALPVQPARVRDIRTLGGWGVAENVSLELDTTPYRISRRIEAARERAAVHAILEMLAALAPPSRTLIEAALAVLLGWLRLLLPARCLDDPGRTVFSAALAAGYSSDTSLHRAFRRFGLPSAGELRRGSTLARAVRHFVDAQRPGEK